MKNESKYRELLLALQHYIVFFLLAAFVINCCLMLFVTTLSDTMDIVFGEEHLQKAAKRTFINVLGLSALLTLLDNLRRKFVIDRPVNTIIAAAEKMSRGDFSVRVPSIHGVLGEIRFNQIGECFNKMAEELSGMEMLRSDFIANVSHELKTPLAVMQSYGTMLQQPGLSEEKRIEYAKAITDASRKLANLISNVLKLNKLENQHLTPSATEYNLSDQLIEDMLQYENVWEAKGIDIDTDVAEDVSIYADAELLSLVWNNLLSNAFKFTERGGVVSVTLTADDKWATVKVADTGCGMKPEVGARIFEKFYQGDTSHSVQGNGLGLALVKRVVDITRGDISVESVYGKGSSFTVKMRRRLNEELESDL